jgi:vacuolar-type H+-ATPase subunit I/STV1
MPIDDPRPMYRLGAIMLVAGSILGVAANLMHPNPPDIGDPIAQLKLISSSAHWGPIHVAIVLASVVRLGGLVGFTASFTGGYSIAWARIGLAGAIVGAAAALVLFAVDGIASQRLAIAWASAPPAELASAWHVAQSNQYVGFGIYGLWIMVFFGLTYICYGLAVAFSDTYPRWLGWVAVAAAIGSFFVGYFQYFSGLTDLLTNKLFPGFAIVLAIWSVVMGGLLWRKASMQLQQNA